MLLDTLWSLLHNRILGAAILAWLIAQLLKFVGTFIREGHFSTERLFGAGGMPSSHSAFVVALAVGVGQSAGWDQPLTAVTIVFSMIVMYDAAGVRRAAGKQARVLNRILHDLAETRQFKEERLKELLGHTPVEVISGAILGILVGFLMFR